MSDIQTSTQTNSDNNMSIISNKSIITNFFIETVVLSLQKNSDGSTQRLRVIFELSFQVSKYSMVKNINREPIRSFAKDKHHCKIVDNKMRRKPLNRKKKIHFKKMSKKLHLRKFHTFVSNGIQFEDKMPRNTENSINKHLESFQEEQLNRQYRPLSRIQI